MKHWLKSAALNAAVASGCLAAKRLLSQSSLRIVTYHGVDEGPDAVVNYDRLQCRPDLFARHLERIGRAFNCVALRDIYPSGDRPQPRNALAVTFDDGYRNNLAVAAPILQRLGIPATFFVTAGFVDGTASPWWYRLRRWLAEASDREGDAVSRAIRLEAELAPLTEDVRDGRMLELGVPAYEDEPYPFMSRDDCRELLAKGFDVQCHGVTHASLGAESSQRFEEEIRGSVEFVHSVGGEPWAIAYPYGHEPRDGKEAKDVMARHGLRIGLTTRTGHNPPDSDRWRLRRWDLHGGYTPVAALARVS